MIRFRISAVILLILCAAMILPVYAQDMDPEMQKAWEEYMTPGWAHKMMASHTGEWKTVSTMWMDPAAPPIIMEGVAKSEMILGGRYLKSTHSGVMMGMPFEGMSLEGYDNAKKEFTSIWIDNLGTGTSVSTGTYDKKTNTITYIGNVYDPMQGKDVKIREIIKLVDKDKYTIEMYNYMGDQEFKSMEIKFERIM
ncbi:MAG TPA: DUF1579 domain-containing protein [Ignavibacteriaceae bacterium]|nr:DUF1579 domain-containing protein [Ignavibacteriaceae bacterium]